MVNKILLKINKIIPQKWQWVLEHEGFVKYFKNTGWMFAGQVFSLFVSFFVGVWVIRYLGPENYGVLSYALAFVTLFSFVASLGIDNILKRELINTAEKRDALMGTAFWLRLVGGLMALILVIVIIFLTDNSSLVRLLVIMYSFIFIFQPFHIITNLFQSRVEANKDSKAKVIGIAISAILKIVLMLSGLGVIWIMLVYLLDSLWLALALIYYYRRSNLYLKDWNFDYSLAKKMLSDSWLLALTSVSVMI